MQNVEFEYLVSFHVIVILMLAYLLVKETQMCNTNINTQSKGGFRKFLEGGGETLKKTTPSTAGVQKYEIKWDGFIPPPSPPPFFNTSILPF